MGFVDHYLLSGSKDRGSLINISSLEQEAVKVNKQGGAHKQSHRVCMHMQATAHTNT